MANRGENQGSSFTGNFGVLSNHGAAIWFEFPYNGTNDPVNYRPWCLNPGTWRNAINYRANPVEYIDVNSNDPAPGLTLIKQNLDNGYVVTFGTCISSWQWTRISDDKSPSSPAVDPHYRDYIAYWVNGEQGKHAMTIVGYDDDIWTDINNDRVVQQDEKGTLRIANSWGTGWRESGFTWLAYDALKSESSVGPNTGRVRAIYTDMVFVLTVKDDDNPYPLFTPYSPKLVAEFTVNHARRNQLRVNLGISDTGTKTPSITWYPGAISLQGGPYAFDGSAVACDGTFVFDFTDILPPENSGTKRYYLGMYDNVSDSYSAKLMSFTINGYTYSIETTVNGGEVYVWLDSAFTNNTGNNPPVAKISATPTTNGPVPLTVTFDGSGSFDPDVGDTLSYYWDFGDGFMYKGKGVPPEVYKATHTYNYVGSYVAKLTVTDPHGASSSAIVSITVSPPDPATTMYVSYIAMSLEKAGSRVNAVATVTILGNLNSPVPVSGATVSGHWSEATSDTDSGVTDASGSVALKSNSIRNPAIGTTFTFTVDKVTRTDWTYDNPSDKPTKSITYNGQLAPAAAAEDYPDQVGQAFPSPANPDTWIPFTLSEAKDVTIRIYSATGQLMRTLDLGQRAPGAYLTKDKAAYWDGRNEAGEHVSSGVYFYTMQAGDFTATKKMLIVR